jgi:hypothetical protein
MVQITPSKIAHQESKLETIANNSVRRNKEKHKLESTDTSLETSTNEGTMYLTTATILESSSNYKFAHRNIRVVKAMIKSTQNIKKKYDVTNTIHKLMKIGNIGDGSQVNILTIDAGKLNEYAGHDIHYSVRKKMELVLAYATDVSDCKHRFTDDNSSSLKIVSNTGKYMFSHKDLTITRAIVKSVRDRTKVEDITCKLSNQITCKESKYLIIDSDNLSSICSMIRENTNHYYLELKLAYN